MHAIYDSYRRNSTEPKIKGQDYEFLKWARDHSQKRLFRNRLHRGLGAFVAKYTDPTRYLRKARQILGIDKSSVGDGTFFDSVPTGRATEGGE